MTIQNLRREHLEEVLGYTPTQGGKFSYNDLLYQYAQTQQLDPEAPSSSALEGYSTKDLDRIVAERTLIKSASEVTVGPGGDFSTIVAALEFMSKMRPIFANGGMTANIRLLSGYVWAEQIRNYRQNLSWITILAEDAVVPIYRAALEMKYHRWYPALLVSDGAEGPTLGCLLDMDDSGVATERVGAYVRNGSKLVVNEYCGIINAAVRGIDCASVSTLHAQDSIWSGAGEIGARVSNGSRAQLTQSVINGCGTVNLSVGGSCDVNATQTDLKNSLGRGIDISGNSNVNADSADVSNAAQEGAYVHDGRLQFTSGKAQNCGGVGLRAGGTGKINAGREGTTYLATDVSGSAGGFWAEQKGEINAEGGIANFCVGDAVKAIHGGEIAFNNGTADDATGRAVVADHGSKITGNLMKGRRAGGVGCEAAKGSTIHAQLADFSGALGTIGIRAIDDSHINFRSGNARRGATDAASDITVTSGSTINAPGATGGRSQAINTLTANGVIYA